MEEIEPIVRSRAPPLPSYRGEPTARTGSNPSYPGGGGALRYHEDLLWALKLSVTDHKSTVFFI